MSAHEPTSTQYIRAFEAGYRCIPGYPGYVVNNIGDVKTLKLRQSRSLIARINPWGYKRVQATLDSRNVQLMVHRAVCLAFHGLPPTATHQVRHLDGNKLNNHEANLAWGTAAENFADQLRHGTAAMGERHASIKINAETATEIVDMYRSGYSARAVAEEFGVAHSTVLNLAKGKLRKQLRLCA